MNFRGSLLSYAIRNESLMFNCRCLEGRWQNWERKFLRRCRVLCRRVLTWTVVLHVKKFLEATFWVKVNFLGTQRLGGRLVFREGEFCIDVPVSGNVGVLYGRWLSRASRVLLDYEKSLLRFVGRAWRERKPCHIISWRFIYGLAGRTKRKKDYS